MRPKKFIQSKITFDQLPCAWLVQAEDTSVNKADKHPTPTEFTLQQRGMHDTQAIIRKKQLTLAKEFRQDTKALTTKKNSKFDLIKSETFSLQNERK